SLRCWSCLAPASTPPSTDWSRSGSWCSAGTATPSMASSCAPWSRASAFRRGAGAGCASATSPHSRRATISTRNCCAPGCSSPSGIPTGSRPPAQWPSGRWRSAPGVRRRGRCTWPSAPPTVAPSAWRCSSPCGRGPMPWSRNDLSPPYGQLAGTWAGSPTLDRRSKVGGPMTARSHVTLVAPLAAAVLYAIACFLPGEPSGAGRVTFVLDFPQPYRVPLAGAAQPTVEITAEGQPLTAPPYHLESLDAGVVRVDPTGRSLEGVARGTASVRVLYETATGAPDTMFAVRVVVSRVAVNSTSLAFTRLADTSRLTATAYDAQDAAVPDVKFAW